MGAWGNSVWTEAGALAAEIDPDGDLAEGARDLSLPAFFAALRAAGRRADAAEFVAVALPRYEAVAWAAQSLLNAGAVDRAAPAMVAVMRWLDDPTDANRRAAGDIAENARRSDAAVELANAVFFSGGSLVGPDLAPVAPRPELCGRIAAGAMLTGMHTLPDADAAIDAALALGEQMARG